MCGAIGLQLGAGLGLGETIRLKGIGEQQQPGSLKLGMG